MSLLLTLCGIAVAAPAVQAQQRNPDQLMGHTVLDEPAGSYRAERFVIESADSRRRWRVNLLVPATMSTQAAPVLYALDGNAAAMVLDQAMLDKLAASAAPPVLVLVGHDNERRIDSPQRTRDYTAWIDHSEDESGAARSLGGGGFAFADMIERRIRPEVERRVNVDPERRALWGHSLGGLFVLSTLYTRPGAFTDYVAASPSLWWAQGAPIGEIEQQYIANAAGTPARLWLMLGGNERAGDRGKRDLSNPRVVAHLKRIGAAPPDAAHALSGRLAKVPGLQVAYREFEGLGHGPMLAASFKAALEVLYGIDAGSGAATIAPPSAD